MRTLLRRRAVFAITASPNPADGSSIEGSGVPAVASSTISMVNGVGPYTHSGAFVSGGVGITTTNATTTTPTWSTADDTVQLRTGTYRHTTIDTANGASASVDIPVTLEVSPI